GDGPAASRRSAETHRWYRCGTGTPSALARPFHPGAQRAASWSGRHVTYTRGVVAGHLQQSFHSDRAAGGSAGAGVCRLRCRAAEPERLLWTDLVLDRTTRHRASGTAAHVACAASLPRSRIPGGGAGAQLRRAVPLGHRTVAARGRHGNVVGGTYPHARRTARRHGPRLPVVGRAGGLAGALSPARGTRVRCRGR